MGVLFDDRHMFRSLDSEKILSTIEALHRRIEERFPNSNLGRICSDLREAAGESKARSEWIAQPNVFLRIGVAVVIAIACGAIIYSLTIVDVSMKSLHWGEVAMLIEAVFNNLVFGSAAVFFLITVEARIKRSRALKALHELRSIAHVIDLHQLTKDPNMNRPDLIVTPSSPVRDMTEFELMRYLDYCTEMLSLTGKAAALYAQSLRDTVVLNSVNDIEELTSGLSRKIWQKLVILHGANPIK